MFGVFLLHLITIDSCCYMHKRLRLAEKKRQRKKSGEKRGGLLFFEENDTKSPKHQHDNKTPA